MKVASIVIARNEENWIRETIKSILAQTVDINPIVLVNDGSKDNTLEMIKDLKCHVISLPFHVRSYLGRPELSIRINIGLSYIKKCGIPDYILITGGDHVLPIDYVEKIIKRMNNNIKVASGHIEGINIKIPLGSGRLVDARFWDKLNGIQYPISYGYESWLVYKTEMMGYETKNFKDIITKGRPIQMNVKKAYCWGRGSYALGSSILFILRRCLIYSLKSPKIGASMLVGYLYALKNDNRLDVADYVRISQIKSVLNYIKK